jgi:hypothetical protein
MRIYKNVNKYGEKKISKKKICIKKLKVDYKFIR